MLRLEAAAYQTPCGECELPQAPQTPPRLGRLAVAAPVYTRQDAQLATFLADIHVQGQKQYVLHETLNRSIGSKIALLRVDMIAS